MNTPHVISSADADYVDVVHTNALIAGLGMMKDGGHLDVYVNGGTTQQVCQVAVGGAANALIPGSGPFLVPGMMLF